MTDINKLFDNIKSKNWNKIENNSNSIIGEKALNKVNSIRGNIADKLFKGDDNGS